MATQFREASSAPTAPAAPAAPTTSDAEKTGASPMPPGRKWLLLVLALLVVLVGGFFGVRYYVWNQAHVTTDDAFVTGNLVNISPKMGGTLAELTVAEGDRVHKGQLIARLDASAQEATLRQAEAALAAAESQVPQARAQFQFQKESTNAAIARAEAAIRAQQAKTQGAGAQLRLTQGTTRGGVQQAQSQVRAAEASAAGARAQIAAAEAALKSAQQNVVTAQRAADALQARISGARADAERATKDEARYRQLVAEGAVAQSQYDTAHAAAETSRANLASLSAQVAEARARIVAARAGVQQTRAQQEATRKTATAAAEQIGVARAGLALARANNAQVGVQSENVAASAAQEGGARADLEAARAGQAQTARTKESIVAAEAAVRQARAAVQNAKVSLRDTHLYAPADGIVVRKGANVGAALSPGQTLLTLTRSGHLWVTANFKETQLSDLRIGQPVEVDADAFPGQHFDGVVADIGAATGATTSLLPPDNATGNFTKVVQRIPVRIALLPKNEELQRLRQGMSAAVTITTREHAAHPERVPKNYHG